MRHRASRDLKDKLYRNTSYFNVRIDVYKLPLSATENCAASLTKKQSLHLVHFS